ncbi:hypothetical protein Tfer_0639 [Thermincola ferriacetica]|uniref:Periplasmic serine protease n=2 Tax=Thermincola TaxID=278993 RepID=D5X987_THEPJ|nr:MULTISPECIES: ATP-dependent Clp protease proteolytic subunit [Thermincola]ADG82991.1 protein of unknown function DUF114 [Thermincola potens JR]KNZ70457.1 hypothetical protein Tfer_0639 [Thermincola ferriacetica]
MSFFDLFWAIFIVMSLIPIINQQKITRARYNLIHEIERKQGCRLITLIHRQESFNLLGILFGRFINIEDSEQVLRAIRLTPQDMPISLVLHTPGGLVLASEQIAHALEKHRAKVTVYIPHYAMSGGTLIALAADEIVMDENAVLGPVDPQIGEYPAASIVKVLEEKERNEIDDKTIILADVAKKALKQVEDFVYGLLKDNLGEEKGRELAKILTEGRWTHDYPITYDTLKEMGLRVTNDLPIEIYRLMELYPQPTQRRPSVQYIPVPYNQNKDRQDR